MQSQITLSLIGRCNGKKQQMAPLLTGSDPTFLAATSLFNLTSNHSPSSIFIIDFLSLYLIFRKCDVSFHCYTADLSIKPTVTLLPTSLFDCILEIQVFSQSLTKYFTWGQSNLSACLSIYLNADSSVQTTTLPSNTEKRASHENQLVSPLTHDLLCPFLTSSATTYFQLPSAKDNVTQLQSVHCETHVQLHSNTTEN